jgi:signal transduction histidine kinase
MWTLGLLGASHLLFVMLALHQSRRVELVVGDVWVWLFAALLMATGALFLHTGVKPLQQLKARMAAVRDGRALRVDGHYPAEVQPLVDDLNALLAHREQLVARALAKAGDLAHGLKQPLAVIAQEADRAAPELAAAIHQQVDRMQRQIDYHLARARAAASGATPGTHCAVADSAAGLARTLFRLRGLPIDLDVAPEHTVRAEREDLDEMLGNLLDNACKWARSRVQVGSAVVDGEVVVTVDDDGPGLDASLYEAVLQRGVRADEAAPGSGLGLAIVRDLVELYGGAITLGRSPTGGLRAQLRLPTA